MSNYDEESMEGAIAIVGMGGRFPGAKSTEEFWNNLYNGVETVRFFDKDQLLKMGVNEDLIDNPRFTSADAILEGMDEFDASFFGYSAREAEIMDPQHRLFLECAWEVLEKAGYTSDKYDGRVAVYGSANLSGYMIHNLYSNPDLTDKLGSFKIMIANGQDFLATKVSYKMNLMGPSMSVNTLCSSSCVAIHNACQNLMNYGCDLALAGGVSFQVSRGDAFFYQEGGIGSSDGHCHAFDSRASGTVSGSGLGVLALKRLEDAIADGDHIHAVIRGTGINNDGSHKNSYTAPNVDGQAECIAEAIAVSGVNPETISYVEAHGTGTDLGDPIEVAALTKAYRSYTKKKQFCALGSVKTNIGHLVNAGGVASVIKTVLSMEHKVLPASLNFKEPNPKIDFTNTPFYVNSRRQKWESNGTPLRAGISSFGIGGTNTHIILEEAPAAEPSEDSGRPYQLIALSAKTATALEKMTGNLLEHIKKNPELNIADIAFTLQIGRHDFNHRRIVACTSVDDLVKKLENMSAGNVISHFQKPKDQPVVFMFPGSGEYVGMGSELYRTEDGFRSAIDECAKILKSQAGIDILKVFNSENKEQQLSGRTGKTVLFAVEYALAQLWMSWGVEPQYLVGEGAGEYAAACIAGTLSLEDALKLAAAEDAQLPQIVSAIKVNRPEIPFVSAVTGDWISDSDAENPQYWLKQRSGVHFEDGLKLVMADSDQIVLEIGPGDRLTSEAMKYKKPDTDQAILSCMTAENTDSEAQALLVSIGKFWLYDGIIDWSKYYAEEKRHRVILPTYPFERQRYWIEPGKRDASKPDVYVSGKEDITQNIVDSDIKQGIITLNVNLEDAKDNKKQLEEMFAFREKLEQLSKEFPNILPNLQISEIGLKTGGKTGLSENGGEKLKLRPRPALGTEYAAPTNEVEKAIIDKWQEVLGFDRIGINDDFFELGGHSLIAAAVATDLSKRFDVQIPFRTLFELTTAKDIAKLVETYRWAAASSKDASDGEELEDGEI